MILKNGLISLLFKTSNIKYLFFNFFCFYIFRAFSYIPETKYIESAKLINENFWIMTNNGILIYDEALKFLENKYEFNITQKPYNYIFNKYPEEYGGDYLLYCSSGFFFFSPLGKLIFQKSSFFIQPIRSSTCVLPNKKIDDIYYFYQIYSYKKNIIIHQYWFNITSSNSGSKFIISDTFDFCPDHSNYVSCQLINYKQEDCIICFMSGHVEGKIYFKIYNPSDGATLETETLWDNYGNEINTAKGIIKGEQKILMATRSLDYIGFDIFDDTYEKHKGKISLINGCSVQSYLNISYFNETEEFILSFQSICNSKHYVLIYSINENFTASYLGAIRPFSVGDSYSCCDPFDSESSGSSYYDWLSYSILFSRATERYLIIGNIQYEDSIHFFYLNIDINIINPDERLSLYSLPYFICENYSNFNDSNCNSTSVLSESSNVNLKLINKCSNYITSIQTQCPLDFEYTVFYIDYIKKPCELEASFKGRCYRSSSDMGSREETFNNVHNLIEGGSIDSQLDNLLHGDKEDIAFTDSENNEYVITSTENLKDVKKKSTSINFGECEDYLKTVYNISDNESLIILKIDKSKDNEKSSIKQVEYEAFHPTTKESLDLSLCQNMKINVFYNIPPINIEDLYKYNQSSDYYNDICFTNNSDNGVDICVKDRRGIYIDNNLPVCEENCELVDFDLENNKSLCSCDIKAEVSIYNNEIDTEALYNKFDGEPNTNIEIIKCYYLLFDVNNLKANIGNYIISSIGVVYLLCLIIFIFIEYKLIMAKILALAEYVKENIFNQKRDISNDIVIVTPPLIKIKNKGKKKIKSAFIQSNPTKKKKKRQNKIPLIDLNKLRSRNKKVELIPNSTNINTKSYQSQLKTENERLETVNDTKREEKPHITFPKEDFMKMNDYEINNLSYEDALKYDKRSYFQYYWALLKVGHICFFAFVPNNDYNSRIIKVCLFLFSFSLYITVNALFFTDETMHNIYVSEGKYNLLYQISQILYSTLISSGINFIIRFLAISQKDILLLKISKTEEALNKKVSLIHKKLLAKFILFFSLSISFLFFFWVYISCFCAVYKNTQIHLIKDTLVSFGLSLTYPFGIYLIPGFIRMPALKSKSKNRECLYKISLIVQLI